MCRHFTGIPVRKPCWAKRSKGFRGTDITSPPKVGRYGDAEFDFSANRVTASVDESLTRLGIDYVDIIQSHDNEYGDLDQVVNETIPALRKLQERGKARFVGVTGYPLKIFRYILERTEVDSILSYNHYSLNDKTLTGLLPFLESKNVGVISASPVSQGLLTNQGNAFVASRT